MSDAGPIVRSTFTKAQHAELADQLLKGLRPLVARVKQLETENHELQERLLAVEARLVTLESRVSDGTPA